MVKTCKEPVPTGGGGPRLQRMRQVVAGAASACVVALVIGCGSSHPSPSRSHATPPRYTVDLDTEFNPQGHSSTTRTTVTPSPPSPARTALLRRLRETERKVRCEQTG